MEQTKFWSIINSCNWAERKDEIGIVTTISEELWKIPLSDLLDFKFILDTKVSILKEELLRHHEDNGSLTAFCYDTIAHGGEHYLSVLTNADSVDSVTDFTEGFSYAIPERYEIQEQLVSY